MRTLKAVGAIHLLALGLLGLLFLTLDVWAVPAGRPPGEAQATLCVNPGGTGGCYASIQAAIDAATGGSTVRVAQGVYYETVELTKSLTLEGGWNADFSARDWGVYVTTIDAQRNGPVIRVYAGISPTIEGFVVTGGDESDGLGWGGGIRVGESFNDVGLTTIRHNVITDNVACNASTCQGEGGGIHVYNNTALIEYNTIVSNVARLSGDGSGEGGGVAVGWQGQVTLTGNVIVSNTAVYTPTGLAEGRGGGVYIYSYGGTLTDNEIHGNVAAVGGVGRGGGVHAGGALYHNRFLSNTASLNGAGYGGGVYGLYVTDFEDNVVLGNVASRNGDGTGGGIWGHYFGRAYRNVIVGNVATRGGGVYYAPYPWELTLRDNLIARNRATGSAEDPPDGGGGVASAADWVTIVNNQILSNTASGVGGGVLFTAGSRYLLQNNRVVSNTAMAGGGVAVYTSTGSISYNHVISNLALLGGGVYVWGAAQPGLDGNVVLSNTALGFFAAGGGVLVNVDAGLSLTLTNHVIARNAAGSGGPGGGVMCWQGDCVLINNTIVDNDRGDYDEGVVLGGSGYAGAHTLFNNVIAGHSTGVELVAGAAALDYNDYYDNDTDVSGATWGAHHRTDDPQFENRAGADYHLALTSPLVDQADGSVAPDRDYEGDPRPRGGGADVGADEAYPAQVYVSADVGSDLTGTGTKTAPFASVTQGLAEVRSGGAVHVARGRYTERITVTRSVDLLGGYRETDWSRDVSAYAATLDAQGTGTVVVIQGADVGALLEGFTITGGEACRHGLGGGVVIRDGAQATIRYNTITGNHAQNGGAGLFIYAEEGTRNEVDSNRIYDNVAEGVFAPCVSAQSPQQGPEPGGGMLVGGAARVVNNLVYSNTAGAGGDGIALLALDGFIQVLHNTVADNGGTSGVGIQVHGSMAELYNNLVVGHGTAISGAQTTWDYNGFYDNGAAYAPGLSAGPHDVSGDPHFADRAGSDYHIGPASAGAGQGSDAGVTVDLEGAARPAPAGSAPDLGAYEVAQRRVYLPLVLKR